MRSFDYIYYFTFLFLLCFFSSSVTSAEFYRVNYYWPSQCDSVCGLEQDQIVQLPFICNMKVPNRCHNHRDDVVFENQELTRNFDSSVGQAKVGSTRYTFYFYFLRVTDFCEVDEDLGVQTWDWINGSQAKVCVNSCELTSRNSVCSDIENTCSANFLKTGETCTFTGVQFGGTPNDPSDTTNPDNGGGDDGGSDGGDTDGGGSDGGTGTTEPENPDGGDPNPDSGNSGDMSNVVNAVQNLASSNSTAINSVNTSVRDVESAVDDLAASNSALIGETNSQLTDANTTLESSNTALESIDGNMQGAADSLSDIADNSNNLANKDVTQALEGNCIVDSSYNNCGSWYESEYKDGLAGIFENHVDVISAQASELIDQTFSNLDLSNASSPSFCLSIWNVGEMCIDDYIDLNWIFSFLRFAFMFSTVMLCRKVIFGG